MGRQVAGEGARSAPPRRSFKFTDAAVEKLRHPKEGRVEYWDAVLPGFGLRVGQRSKTWQAMYRVGSSLKRAKLGRYPVVTLADARKQAGEIFVAAEKGIDFAAQQKATRKASATRGIVTIADAISAFMKKAEREYRSACEYRRIFGAYVVQEAGEVAVADFSRAHLHRITDPIIERGSPVQANRVFSALRLLMNWLVDRGDIPRSPLAGMKRPGGREDERERVLLPDELRAIWRASETAPYPFGAIVRLAMLTAQRRDEAGNLRWPELDLDAGIWMLPRSRSKNNRAHILHLAPAAVEMLRGLHRVTTKDGVSSDYLFTIDGVKPFNGYSRAKVNFDAAVLEVARKTAAEAGEDPDQVEPLPNWTLHDLRRTAATEMAGIGIAPHVVDRILNHQSGTIRGVAAIYNRHEYLEERKAALHAWANRLHALVADERSDNVIRLERV